MFRKLSLFIVLSLGLSACSLLERAQESGYAYSSEDSPSTVQDFYRAKKAKNWRNAQEELGINSNHELTDMEAQNIANRVELHRLETNLISEVDKKQYYSLKPFFHSDLERIYFLRLPNRDSRERWANAKGLTTEVTSFDPSSTQLIENNDIGKGMLKEAVRQSWGDPDFVDVAGNPLYGNERWKYNKLVSTQDGYKSESRIVYFEAGRVVGWETL